MKFIDFHCVCFHIRKSGFSRKEDRFSVFRRSIRKEPRLYKEMFALVAVYMSIERAIFLNLHSEYTCVDRFYVEYKKNKVLKMLFFIKNRDNRARFIDNYRVFPPS